jgi:hypothetical protein
VINVQDRYNHLIENIHTEASRIADLYRDAGYFREAERDSIRASLRSYVDYVINEEWKLPAQKGFRPQAIEDLERIWNSYYAVSVEGSQQEIWYQESISKLNDLMNARLERQFNSWDHLQPVMWALLIIGGLCTICFMFFFVLENFQTHTIFTALLTGYLAFMLYVVYSLDNSSKGSQAIGPEAFEQLVPLFERWDGNPSKIAFIQCALPLYWSSSGVR